MKVATLIKNRREELGISQRDLGNRLGFDGGQFVSNIERNKCVFPVDYIAKASKALKLDPGAIIDAMISDYREKLEKRAKQK